MILLFIHVNSVGDLEIISKKYEQSSAFITLSVSKMSCLIRMKNVAAVGFVDPAKLLNKPNETNI